VVGATPVPIAVTGTAYARAGQIDAARASVASALGALQGTLDIGDTVRRAKLIEIIMDQPAVVDVTLDAPTTNVPIAPDAIAVLVLGLSWLEA
jgi:hypothetical protein